MYHNIAPLPRGVTRYRGLYVKPRAFAHQLGLLHALGYRALSMSDAMPYLRGDEHGRVVVITLDDGYADNVDNALALLQHYGFTATCYVVSGAVGRYNEWDSERLGLRKPLMNADQLRAWHAAGMEVGAHSRTHARLSRCSPWVMKDEVRGSKADLEDVISAPVTQFCYPYGDVNDAVVEATREAGYEGATTVQRGRAVPGSDLLRLPRVAVSYRHILPQFAMRAFTRYEDRRA
ncbi:peptidoglycan/xylan/chitin deacetylase (PgdA/CDA1 family) [Luteibacter sp. Sphag1AF]|uniref:polysaccharide deacetylase family protein n=1 Tax=Luteibacter sp. Sphag1AF TaxID=2587031 RepID=UPI001614AFAD|nr:polysaccharide deacetylase family protein [Luteibacter sp. Sphag1AF]MBB3227794.1 peptidoglycan/xylan/chitin deacetylase (PgdA/CDA1 family) [Luteibacter sp. Sphag1AF]